MKRTRFYGQTAAEIGLFRPRRLYLAALAAFTMQALRRLTPSRRRRRQPVRRAADAADRRSKRPRRAKRGCARFAVVAVPGSVAAVLGGAGIRAGVASKRETAPAEAPLPAPLRRMGRWALSGGLAVALAAQILPMGLLLTPVEAYTEPGTWTLVSTTSPLWFPHTGAVTPGTTLSFQVLANYKNASGQPVQLDVTSDSGTSYWGAAAAPVKVLPEHVFPPRRSLRWSRQLQSLTVPTARSPSRLPILITASTAAKEPLFTLQRPRSRFRHRSRYAPCCFRQKASG